MESSDSGPPELQLDDSTQQGFVAWFLSLPNDPTIVRFFDRKGYYSVHGEPAVMIARQVYKTTAMVKYLGGKGNKLEGVTLNCNVYASVLRELLLEQSTYTVEMYEGSGASWKLTRFASPGRLTDFEEELFRSSDMVDCPVVVALQHGQLDGARTVGLAYVNVTARQLGAAQFADDDQFCNLEAVLVQLGARECVLMKETEADSTSARRLRDVLSRCNVLTTERPRSLFSTKNLDQDLARLIRGGNVEQHRDVLERQLASGCLAAVISFTELTSDSSGHGSHVLQLYNMSRYMRCDAAAHRALNVMKGRGDRNDSFSLYGIMNRGRTPMGKRLLKVWLKQPLVDVDEISQRHDIVESFVGDAELRERMRNTHLRGMPDVERLCRKLERKKVSLSELCQLYRASSKLGVIVDTLACHEGTHAHVLASRYAEPLLQCHDEEHLQKFEELLEAAIDLSRVPEEYVISANYDANLQDIDSDKVAVEREIQRLAEAAADDLDLQLDKTIKLEWHKANNNRTRCLRITQKEEKAVRSKLQAKYMLLETRKDGTKFTNRALKDAAERLQSLTKQYNEAQRQLVEQVVGVAHTFVEVWEPVAQLLAELDVLLGFADLAVNAPTPYVRPIMLPPDEGTIVLSGCRHPIIEAQDTVDFIPNDCIMERGKSWFQIITGPNMGGKSTFIRQVGVNVMMAQIGSFVPCTEARIAVRDAIFARVGAGDCQLRGVSTFMAEMLETASILKAATSKSLVIIDELGRGTSTYDGFGLAWAISEHIMQVIGCPTLFATHFHELTGLRSAVGVANRHVETAVDPANGKLCMLYQVKDGACDQSFGIHVAEFARFPDEVVQLAKAKAQELERWTQIDVQQAGMGSGDIGCKRDRPVDEAESDASLRQFLEAFAALPLESMDPQAALKQVAGLLEGVDSAALHMPPIKKMVTPA